MSADDQTSTETDRFGTYPHPRETTILLGQGTAETAMLEAYRAGRMPHAWILGGSEGIGKATLAWRFARFVLANPAPSTQRVREAVDLSVPRDHPAARGIAAGGIGDVAVLRLETNEKTGRPYTEIRVDDVRRVSGLFQQAARAGGYRICIIDSAEDLNRNSANALLKLIEEPPPLSLFLIVSHHPARLLPTVRSRCRVLHLGDLTPALIVAVLRTLDVGADDAAMKLAAERSGGSVRGALHWLGGERLALHRETTAALDKLPQIDWAGLHRLGDRVTSPDDFALILEGILDWVHDKASAPSGIDRRRLAPLAEVWDKVRRSGREAEALNLDKRAAILSIFADLSLATRLP